MQNRLRISPSILAADFARLGSDILSACDGGADFIHADVMDGHFVPNLSIGVPVVKSLSAVSPVPLDVHLMIENPSRYLAPFAEAGAGVITVHLEAADIIPVSENLKTIRRLGCLAGLSVKPGTAVRMLEPFIPFCDLVLVMTVEPGFGGQGFLPGSLERIAETRRLIEANNPACMLEIDGGVDETNIARCVSAGADVIVAGSSVFKPGEDYADRVRLLRSLAAGNHLSQPG